MILSLEAKDGCDAFQALERWAFEWTREDDKQVLKLAHRLGYASWMARRCAETLLAHLDQGSADRLKVCKLTASMLGVALKQYHFRH